MYSSGKELLGSPRKACPVNDLRPDRATRITNARDKNNEQERCNTLILRRPGATTITGKTRLIHRSLWNSRGDKREAGATQAARAFGPHQTNPTQPAIEHPPQITLASILVEAELVRESLRTDEGDDVAGVQPEGSPAKPEVQVQATGRGGEGTHSVSLNGDRVLSQFAPECLAQRDDILPLRTRFNP